MNKYFVIGMLTAGVMFAVYDIFKTIEVKREIERNKKIRQKKYEQTFNEYVQKQKEYERKLKELKDQWMTLKRN